MSDFEIVDEEIAYGGKFIRAGVVSVRHADGALVTREKVWHPGAVGMLAIDGEHVWLTRQPREAAGVAASLEVPAGKLDVPGEPPLDCAKRELVEEIGKSAANWREICSFLASPGFSDERVWLYLATDLTDAPGGAAPDHDERIEIVPWPLSELDGAIAKCEDAKSLIALLWLARRRGASRGE
jgi:ADP-ribose pyrophosphatase